MRSLEGASTQVTSMLEPGKNQGPSLLIFFSLGYVAYICLVDAVVSCFRTSFLSSGGLVLPNIEKNLVYV